jgi:hypothetical protein
MWGIIKKIRMFHRLEKGGFGEAPGAGYIPLAPLGPFCRTNVRV